jgi:hypothetical protein
VETNRRLALPFEAGREFESACYAPASLSAAVAIWLNEPGDVLQCSLSFPFDENAQKETK